MIKATMKFFNNNPSGRILNRFSKDIGAIDEYLPSVIADVVDVSYIHFNNKQWKFQGIVMIYLLKEFDTNRNFFQLCC